MSHYCQYYWNSYLDYWLQHCLWGFSIFPQQRSGQYISTDFALTWPLNRRGFAQGCVFSSKNRSLLFQKSDHQTTKTEKIWPIFGLRNL